MLSGKYLGDIPEASRAAEHGTLSSAMLSQDNARRVAALAAIATRRGQSLAQLALAWVLRDRRVTSALIGVRTVAQLDDDLAALANLQLSEAELAEIDVHAVDVGIDIWAASHLVT